MAVLGSIGLKFKLGIGIVSIYASFEAYMFIRTQYVIKSRKDEYQKLLSQQEQQQQQQQQLKTIPNLNRLLLQECLSTHLTSTGRKRLLNLSLFE